MRSTAVFLLLLPLAARAQGTPDAYEIAQRFANSGALQAALARTEQLQPVSPTAPGWGDWEQLRCSVLQRLDKHQDLIRRAAAMPSSAPAQATRACLLQAARAAIATGDGGTARSLLAPLIWRHGPSARDMQAARMLVIESYLAERNAQAAYLLMLRFDQDYKPLEPEVAARFADALLASRMEKAAVNWLARLEDASAVKIKLLLQTRLLTPESAIAQARAALAKPGADAAAYWAVLQQAASLQSNRALQVEALEQLLLLADDRVPGRTTAAARELWDGYVAAAQEVGNRQQLLLGDEGNWSDFASRQLASNPPIARAFFAALALKSKVRSSREGAQLQLVHALHASGLAAAALRLFNDPARFPPAQLDAHVRYVLGGIAAERGQSEAAARYWLGLDTPAGVEPEEWRLRLAQVLIRAGAVDPATQALQAAIAGNKAMPVSRLRRTLALLQELHESGHRQDAEPLYRALLPLAAAQERREILFALGTIAAGGSDFQRAADHFLESALLVDARPPDAFAVNARLHAASNLARAGLKADARAQLAWLEKNVSDAEKRELVRREMLKL